ncbi:MAG TPA: protein-disulfide reductase DsbD family protein [Elainellaceae cyanobacterium]
MQHGRLRSLLTLFLAIAAWLWVLPAPTAFANPVQTEHVEVQLVSELQHVQPGSPFLVGLRFQIQDDWHIYWKNPGDSGASPTIDWQLPEGVTAGEIQWPAPERLPVGPLMNFGYSGEVYLPVQLILASTLQSSEPLPMQADADWLVCKVDCIPESATLNLTLPIQSTASPNPQWQPALEATQQALPQPSPWPVTAAIADNTVTLRLEAPGLQQGNLQSVAFFPDQDGVIVNASPQTLTMDDAGLSLTTEQGYLTDLEEVSGVLVLEESLDTETVTRAVEFTAPVSATLPASSQSTSGLALWQAMGLAFLGGLVLNLMPCVFPVLSLKALSIVQKAEKSPRQVKLQAIAFTAGVLVSFTVIVSVLLALRALGQQIGWGFQLQSPWFVALMAYLMFAVGLSLSGVFVFGANLMGIGQGLAAQSGYRGEFFSGVFATVVATPCTAPFMATAIGVALTQSPLVAIAIFEMLALGSALPYIVLSLTPALRNRLPKPGAWMETFQQFLAFPMYGATAWLVWVLTLQAGSTGLAAVLSGLILIAFAAWLHQKTQLSPRLWKRAGTAAALLVLGGALTLTQVPTANSPGATQIASSTNNATSLNWEPYTAQRLEALKAANEPVFVNFSASWCITCLVNEKVALSQPEVAAAFEQKGVAYLKADWTNRDEAIAQTLESFGRSGVPLYLAYPAGASEPRVLPQLLTPEIVVEAIAQL